MLGQPTTERLDTPFGAKAPRHLRGLTASELIPRLTARVGRKIIPERIDKKPHMRQQRWARRQTGNQGGELILLDQRRRRVNA